MNLTFMDYEKAFDTEELLKLFTLALEDVFRKLDLLECGINMNDQYLSHLRYADDIIIMTQDAIELDNMINELNEEFLKIGLKKNISKTKVMLMGEVIIQVKDQKLERVEEYINMGQKIVLGKENQTVERRLAN
ncbi:hypothetical protein HUJ04_007136 [Dendroctonus ponderosae]|nr:hypothetical protein HUJ04_007136 [Dendroctonus ponderosae]